MEKISGILKGNARVTSVDIEDAPPVRPGAPSNGRKPGRNTIADKVTLSEKAKELAAQDPIGGRNFRDISRSKKVEELNKRFFETRLSKLPEKEVPQSQAVADQMVATEDFAPISPEDVMSQFEMEPVLSPTKAPTQAPVAQAPTPRLSIEA